MRGRQHCHDGLSQQGWAQEEVKPGIVAKYWCKVVMERGKHQALGGAWQELVMWNPSQGVSAVGVLWSRPKADKILDQHHETGRSS